MTNNGGLHEALKNISVKDAYIIDVDSFYPSIIINKNLYPPCRHKERYRELLQLKRDGNKEVKLLLNILYGLCSEDIRKQITAYGREAMQDLINAVGGTLIQVNTDGIIVKDGDLNNADRWARKYNFVITKKHLKALNQRDVNNYCALLDDDTVIKKGAILNHRGAEFEAVCKHLLTGRPLEEAIKKCDDYTKIEECDYYEDEDGRREQTYYCRYIFVKTGGKSYTINGKTIHNIIVVNSELEYIEPLDIDYEKYIEESKEILRKWTKT